MALETTKLAVDKYLKKAENRAAYVKAAVRGKPVARVSAIGQVAKAIGAREFAKQTGLSRS